MRKFPWVGFQGEREQARIPYLMCGHASRSLVFKGQAVCCNGPERTRGHSNNTEHAAMGIWLSEAITTRGSALSKGSVYPLVAKAKLPGMKIWSQS